MQPALPTDGRHCLYCGTALTVRRWTAHPPPPIVRPGSVRRRYLRPSLTPRYPTVPRWGFPASVWVPDAEPAAPPAAMPVRGLRAAVVTAALTALLALVAAGAESWRFALVLRGRREVLPAGVVSTSDLLVVIVGWVLLPVSLVTVLTVGAALVRAHPAAHRFVGAAPVSTPLRLWLRLGVPGWNLVGAGSLVTEVEALTAGRLTSDGRPRSSALSRWWWAAFVASEVLVVWSIARSFGRTEQAMADAIELRIAVDLVAALLATLTVALSSTLLRRTRPRRTLPAGWVVTPPVPSRPVVPDPQAARRRSGVLPPAVVVGLPGVDEVPLEAQPRSAAAETPESAVAVGGGKDGVPSVP